MDRAECYALAGGYRLLKCKECCHGDACRVKRLAVDHSHKAKPAPWWVRVYHFIFPFYDNRKTQQHDLRSCEEVRNERIY